METIAVALSEAVDGDLERALRHLELLGELCVGQAFQLRADGGFELFEEMSLARGGVVGLELSHGVVEKVEGFRSSVSHSYNERLQCEEEAAEQQAAMVDRFGASLDAVGEHKVDGKLTDTAGRAGRKSA